MTSARQRLNKLERTATRDRGVRVVEVFASERQDEALRRYAAAHPAIEAPPALTVFLQRFSEASQ